MSSAGIDPANRALTDEREDREEKPMTEMPNPHAAPVVPAAANPYAAPVVPAAAIAGPRSASS
jgi:hypothetical protein